MLRNIKKTISTNAVHVQMYQCTAQNPQHHLKQHF